MYQLQLRPLTIKIASSMSLTIRNNSILNAIVNNTHNNVHSTTKFIPYLQHRHQMIHTTSSTNKLAITATIFNDNIFTRMIDKIKFYFAKDLYRGRAFLLYRNVADSIDFVGFIKDFRMPDTYYSWFLITELHVWMLMVKLIAHGKIGKEMQKHLVGAMWEDADVRRKQLGNLRTSVVTSQMELIGHQFYAAVIGYDEGLMSDDQILAGAVWRRFLQSECNNPELVEKLVIYIRKNMNILDNLPFDVLVKKKNVTFIHRDKC